MPREPIMPGDSSTPGDSGPGEGTPRGTSRGDGAPAEAAPRVRVARRHDVPALVELRVRYLAETARIEPRFGLLPDVRDRIAHALPVWVGQDERVLLVAEEGPENEGTLVGYATGLVGVWPPVLREQHVGEVSEVYVAPDRRGRGVGRAMLARLMELLVARGAHVLRAPVPVKNEALLSRFEALGYEPLQFVMERNLEEV
jgi:GNAT superfamily N-acetyltransferase